MEKMRLNVIHVKELGFEKILCSTMKMIVFLVMGMEVFLLHFAMSAKDKASSLKKTN